ncbi:hypothetical protein LINGRAHAP2_LOCUS14333 [Linum grandiflorum]
MALNIPPCKQLQETFWLYQLPHVASEYAFNFNGRFLHPHRSRLHYSTVEAMMCTMSWIMEDMPRDSEDVVKRMK